MLRGLAAGVLGLAAVVQMVRRSAAQECLAGGETCSDDAERCEDYSCSAGFCTYVEDDCAVDAQCAKGQLCIEGSCFTPECTTDDDCLIGEFCEGGRGVRHVL